MFGISDGRFASSIEIPRPATSKEDSDWTASRIPLRPDDRTAAAWWPRLVWRVERALPREDASSIRAAAADGVGAAAAARVDVEDLETAWLFFLSMERS